MKVIKLPVSIAKPIPALVIRKFNERMSLPRAKCFYQMFPSILSRISPLGLVIHRKY